MPDYYGASTTGQTTAANLQYLQSVYGFECDRMKQSEIKSTFSSQSTLKLCFVETKQTQLYNFNQSKEEDQKA